MRKENFYNCIYEYKYKSDRSLRGLEKASCFATPFGKSDNEEFDFINIYAPAPGSVLALECPQAAFKFTIEELKEIQKYFAKSDYIFDFEEVDLDIRPIKGGLESSFGMENIDNHQKFIKFTVKQENFKSFDSFMLCCHFIRFMYENYLYVFVKKALIQKRKYPKISIITLIVWAVLIIEEDPLFLQQGKSDSSHRTFSRQGLAGYPVSYLQIKQLEKSRHTPGKKVRANNFISTICREYRDKNYGAVSKHVGGFKRNFDLSFVDYTKQFEENAELKQIIKQFKLKK
jgi:hypothetical protein